MSIRAKLTWAFILVTLVALIPAALILNAGIYASTMGPRYEEMRRGPMAGPRSGGVGAATPPADSPRQFLVMAQSLSVWSSLAAFLLAGGSGYLIAGRITRSLRTLRDAARQIDLSDLSRRVPVEGRDEIADLAGSFNHMCDRLEVEEQARRHLLADVAHELRHPLAVLQGRLELMQDGKVEVDQEALLPLQDEVIRLTRLVGDLRDLSLAEVGRLSLHRSQVDIREILQTLLVNLEPVAAAKSVRLEGDVPPDLPMVEGDADRLRQVMVNLLSNALQYTLPGGAVTLRAWQAGDSVALQVTDTGPGISPADLPHLFDRFYRADKSRSRGTGGTGLGLAIVRSLVALHYGKVEVSSRVGEGTSFTVSLPLRQPTLTQKVI